MKIIPPLRNAYQGVLFRAALLTTGLGSVPAWAQSLRPTDLTQDPTGGKKLSDIMGNVDSNVSIGATLALGIFSLIGIFIFVLSLVKLRSHNPQDSKATAIAGLVIGPVLFGVTGIMWAVRNGIL